MFLYNVCNLITQTWRLAQTSRNSTKVLQYFDDTFT